MYMRSSSTSTGFCSITVTFEIGRDPDLAAVDVQNRVNQALGRMPGRGAHQRHLGARRTRPGSSARSGSTRRTTATTRCSSRNYVDLYVRDAFKRVPGVGNVIIFGERKFAMRLWLDPGKLAGRGLTPGDVVNALREQNVQVAAGSIGDSPSAADQTVSAERARRRPAHRGRRVRGRRRQGRPGRRARAREGRRPRRARRRELLVAPAVRRRRGVGHRHPAAADGQRHRGRSPASSEELERLRAELPAGARGADRVRQRRRRAGVDHRGAEDARRGDRPRRARDVPVPAELAQHADSGDHHSGLAHRHLRVRASSSASRSTR